MAIKSDREYRYFAVPLATRAAKANEGGDEAVKDYSVEGYATTFEPYSMGTDIASGAECFELIDRHAFDKADMSDVILRYDHEGMVYARSKNKTLTLSIDDHGLKVTADLSSTEASRAMYDAIDKGLVDQMSFAFSYDDENVEYDKKTRTRTFKRIKKVYDVSPVSIPANPDTDICAIQARDYVHGVMDMEKAERLEREKRLALAKAIYNYQTI